MAGKANCQSDIGPELLESSSFAEIVPTLPPPRRLPLLRRNRRPAEVCQFVTFVDGGAGRGQLLRTALRRGWAGGGRNLGRKPFINESFAACRQGQALFS